MGFFCPSAPSWIGLNVEKNIKTMKLQGCLVRRSRGNIWIRDLHSKPWENASHKIYHRSYHLDCKRLDFQCSYILDELYFSMFIWHLTKTTRYFFRKNQFKRNAENKESFETTEKVSFRRLETNFFFFVLGTLVTFGHCLDIIITEAVVWRCSLEKVFLEISQNLQKSTCARATFK